MKDIKVCKFFPFYLFIKFFFLLVIINNIYHLNNILFIHKKYPFNYKLKKITKKLNTKIYFDYIDNCAKLKLVKKRKIKKRKHPFLSVCICVYNSEKYIEKAILSAINQSFQDFEIIIINDYSNDNSFNIIEKIKKIDKRIKSINHKKNQGIYNSRIEGILNSKGQYVFFLDSDDLILNPYLFEILFNYYNFFYLDIIEFIVYYQREDNKKIFYPKKNYLNHNHSFSDNILYQPQLSNILFYEPRTKKYSRIICRTIWSKIYKKDLLLKVVNYIGKDYYNKNIIFAEDTSLNIISFHFANNYTNINLPGYLYNIRKYSITRSKKFAIKRSIKY